MRQRIFFVAAIIAAGGIAACSSGGSVPSASGSSGGSGGGSPATSGYVVATLGSSAQTVTLAPVGGVTGTITLPAGTGSVAIQSSTVTPSGTVAVQSLTQAVVAHTPLYYLTIAATSSAVTFSGTPAFSVTFTSAPSGTLYEGEATVNGGYSYWGTIGSALSLNGNSLAVPSVSGTVALAAGQSLYLSVYSGGVLPTPAARPDNVGNTFNFTGSLTDAATYNYPSPIPSTPAGVGATMPPTTGTAQVTAAIVVQASPTPFFATTAGVVDVHSVETDAFALRSNTATTDAWFATTPSAYLLYGSFTGDGAGDTFSTQFANPQIVDQLPEGQATWTNSPAATLVESDADGTSSTRTIGVDGSYTDNQTIPDGFTSNIVVNADGSGSYTGTAFTDLAQFGGFTFSAPVGGVVTISVPTGPTTSVVVATPPSFYGASPVLYAESDVLTPGVAFAPACAVPTQFGVSGNQIVQTISRIDPVLGYTETETITTYDQPGIGPVCVTAQDTQNYYYNYSNDNGNIGSVGTVFGNGSVQSVLTSSEVLNLQSTTAIVPTGSVRRSQIASQPLAPATIGYARSQFDAHLQKQRRQHADALRTLLIRMLNRSGVRQ